MVIPTSTHPQDGNKWAYRLKMELVKGKTSWVVCNHISTIATSRLELFNDGRIRVPEDEFGEIVRLLQTCLPQNRPIKG